jgi:hypothetical protein
MRNCWQLWRSTGPQPRLSESSGTCGRHREVFRDNASIVDCQEREGHRGRDSRADRASAHGAVGTEVRAPVEGFSAVLIPQALRRMNAGNGEVGTTTLTDRDYDMAIKGLVPMLYPISRAAGRDRSQVHHGVLIPPHMTGGHERSTEVVELVPVIGNVPESEKGSRSRQGSQGFKSPQLHRSKAECDPECLRESLKPVLQSGL